MTLNYCRPSHKLSAAKCVPLRGLPQGRTRQGAWQEGGIRGGLKEDEWSVAEQVLGYLSAPFSARSTVDEVGGVCPMIDGSRGS